MATATEQWRATLRAAFGLPPQPESRLTPEAWIDQVFAPVILELSAVLTKPDFPVTGTANSLDVCGEKYLHASVQGEVVVVTRYKQHPNARGGRNEAQMPPRTTKEELVAQIVTWEKLDGEWLCKSWGPERAV